MAHAVIIDGEMIEKTVTAQKINKKRIYEILKDHSLDAKDVFLMTMSDDGSVNLIPKENE